MRFTRRLFERPARVAAFSTCAALVVGAASCSDGDRASFDVEDAGSQQPTTPVPVDAAEPVDASAEHDIPLFDGGALPVVCDVSPCATAISTTLGANDSDFGEGFCALLNDGTVACWGANGAGQLGRGEEASSADSATAERVEGVSNAVALEHTCAIDADGGAWCWGTGPYLRDQKRATTTERSAVKLPLPPVKKLGVGADVACAVTDDGVVCWGSNMSAQIQPFETSSKTAVLAPQPVSVPAGGPARALVVGKASFLLREDGTALSWGANPPLARLSSLSPDPYPRPVALPIVTSVDVVGDNACATAGGIGYCWGGIVRKTSDPPGSALLDRAMPEPVPTPEPIVQIATTRTLTRNELGDTIVQPQRWCACTATGKVYCAGYNESGQAGDGSKEFAYRAVQVVGLPGPAAQVKTTPDATCALLTSGKVFCWGSNAYGQLGAGKLKEPSLEPREVKLP